MIGMMGYGVYGWVGLIINLVITVAILIGLAFLVIWIVRRANSGGQFLTIAQRPGEAASSPKEILQARYARGEITRDQYLQMLADLNQ